MTQPADKEIINSLKRMIRPTAKIMLPQKTGEPHQSFVNRVSSTVMQFGLKPDDLRWNRHFHPTKKNHNKRRDNGEVQ